VAGRFYVWREGPSFGVFAGVEVSEGGAPPGRYWLSAASDGVRWSATLREGPHNSPGPGKLARYTSARHLPVDVSLLFAWARETVQRPQEMYTADAAAVLGLQAVAVRDPAVPLDLVTYRGFEKARKRSAHTLAQLHGQVVRALAAARQAWGWGPRALEVSFHETGRAYGLAYAPGSEASKALCRVSLSHKLLRDYDLASAWRVLVHELCHHYREEAWPRTRATKSTSHDERFCEALAKVDPVVGSDPQACRFFTDEEAPGVVAKKRERKAKREANITWAPNAGTLWLHRLQSGKLRIEWAPAPGLSWKYMQPVGDDSLLELAQRFAPADWPLVRVRTGDQALAASGSAYARAANLAELLDGLLARFAKLLPKTGAYVAGARRAA
jgi:hypothetical protein